MKIHYLNAAGEEKMIDGVVHLQNVDNETFIATIEGGKELTLRVSRIEGVADMDMLEKKEIKVSPEMLHHFSRNMRATPADFGIIRITVGAWRSIADLLEAAASDRRYTMEYIRKSDALDLLDKALVRSVESGGGREASGLVTAKCQIAAVPAVDVMPRAEHECALKECENGYAATLHLERSRIANQREEINRLLEHARKVEKSRIYWKDKAMRLGKQLHETLYGRNEE